MTPNADGTDRAFVAYSGRDSGIAETIRSGVGKANRMLGRTLRYEPWIFNDIAGQPLVSPIIAGIDASKFVVADITYLNPNVVYEVGYAIGRGRRCFLICNNSIEGDRQKAGSRHPILRYGRKLPPRPRKMLTRTHRIKSASGQRICYPNKSHCEGKISANSNQDDLCAEGGLAPGNSPGEQCLDALPIN